MMAGGGGGDAGAKKPAKPAASPAGNAAASGGGGGGKNASSKQTAAEGSGKSQSKPPERKKLPRDPTLSLDRQRDLDLAEKFTYERQQRLFKMFRMDTVACKPVKPVKTKRPPGEPGPHPKNTPETTALLRTIYSAAKASDPAKALEAYHRLPIKPDVKIYTALLGSFVKEGLIAEAVEIWHDIRYRKVTPNLATFRALIHVCESANHLERAFWAIKELLRIKSQAKNPKPNTAHAAQLNEIYNTALRICYRKYAPSRAATLFTLMARRGMDHTRIIRTTTDSPTPTAPINIIPWEFVLRFADASGPDSEMRARRFHFEMERVLKPHPLPNPYLEESIGGVPVSQAHQLITPIPKAHWEL